MLKKTKLYAESWNVAWRKANPGQILTDKKTEFNIINNSYRYWAADPFLFEHNGEVYIFAELYDYIRRRGGIGYYKLNPNNKSKWIPIIFEDYHLSYPYIFEADGEIYIMPEANASNSLYLYRAVNFPDKWEKADVLRENIKLADTTIFKWENNRLALSFNVEDPHNPALCLLDLNDKNKDVVVMSENTNEKRSAGKHLPNNIRPAQNCEEDYGKGLIFYSYTVNNHKYSETEIERVFPCDLEYSKKVFLDGMHTYNYCNGYEVVDIKTRRFNLLNLIFRTIGKIM